MARSVRRALASADRRRTAATVPSSPPVYGLDCKADPLGQRQIIAIIDGVGRPPHIGPPAVRTALPPAAGLLLTAERATDLGARRPDIDVGDAAVRPGGRNETLGFFHVVCKNR